MKVYQVLYKDAYSEHTYIIAATDAISALAIARRQEVCETLDGRKYWPPIENFSTFFIEGVCARKEGIKSLIKTTY